MMFNPFKTMWKGLCLTLFCMVMSYTHAQAFKMGATIHQKPLLEKTAKMLGILPEPPPEPTSAEEIPLLSDVFGWMQEQAVPPTAPTQR